ncbi:MAG TPA: GNAT family N-acetyltransferase [Acidimicrobiales bacterium]|nr:GNAT family N-acetyltransferase [Acidimicrobiales bacterium]
MAEATAAAALESRLRAHLRHFLGAWPPSRPLEVVGSPLRERPGWDGAVRPAVGVATPAGAVVSVPPGSVGEVAAAARRLGLEGLVERLPALLGVPERRAALGVFRACRELVDLPDAGAWLAPDDARVPAWLRPFNGEVLVAFDAAGRYAAGVGRKRHDALGQELAVATEPAHRNRGLGRRLVAQAARRVYAEGAVALYLHRPDNAPSAALASAAGFPDLGWRAVVLAS